ncbi:unnamed protein product [Sphagnum balticum]
MRTACVCLFIQHIAVPQPYRDISTAKYSHRTSPVRYTCGQTLVSRYRVDSITAHIRTMCNDAVPKWTIRDILLFVSARRIRGRDDKRRPVRQSTAHGQLLFGVHGRPGLCHHHNYHSGVARAQLLAPVLSARSQCGTADTQLHVGHHSPAECGRRPTGVVYVCTCTTVQATGVAVTYNSFNLALTLMSLLVCVMLWHLSQWRTRVPPPHIVDMFVNIMHKLVPCCAQVDSSSGYAEQLVGSD